MNKKIFFAIAFAATMAGCTEDFKEWAEPQRVAQPDMVAFKDGNVAAVSDIQLNSLADDVDSVQVCQITAPTATNTAYTPNYKVIFEDFNVYDLDVQGRMAVADLQNYLTSNFGSNPNVKHAINAVVEMWIGDGAAQVKTATSGTFQITASPKAPIIEAAYYVTGSINGWDNTDKTYKLTNNGADPYENPVYTCRINAPEDGSNVEFKMTPESGLGGDWSGCLAADEEGKFSYNNVGGNFVITAVEGAKFYDLTFNMMEQTWSYKAVNFDAFIYEIGNSHGWSTSMPLYGSNGDGKYQGYYYLDGGFKFKPNENNWDGDWGQDPNAALGKLVQEGEQDCQAAAGFYQIDVDLAAMTWSITPVTSISIIGTVNGNWDTDTDLTYNVATGAWETTATLTAGAMKFRMNHDWAISWGGANGDATAYDNLTQNNGKDLDLTENGTYFVQLFISYEGNNKVVITKQ